MKCFSQFLLEGDLWPIKPASDELLDVELAMIDISIARMENDPIKEILNRRRDRVLTMMKARLAAKQSRLSRITSTHPLGISDR